MLQQLRDHALFSSTSALRKLADEEFPLTSRFDLMPRVGVSLSNDRSMIHWMLDMHERSDRQNFIQECLKKECVYQTGNEERREAQ